MGFPGEVYVKFCLPAVFNRWILKLVYGSYESFIRLIMLPQEKTTAFLAIADQFRLGHLVTEGFHPETVQLSYQVKNNSSGALKILQKVDQLALERMAGREKELFELACTIQQTLQAGNKIFMCGCGATGRLSLVLETLFHQKFGRSSQVVSFMAGGDFALIKSVESFEDRTEYGKRQLVELGFGPHDLLLASTEGGETPFVIGACNEAARISSRAPYFLYCNPDDVLKPIERSREVLENPAIKKVNLTVGPMAISGSTRMQASTVLMLAIGVGLLYEQREQKQFSDFYHDFLARLKTAVDYSVLAPFTELEARTYQEGRFVNYLAHADLAISILTDTTERSPTFSLKGFENILDESPEASLSYLFIPSALTSAEAWQKLLGRGPRALHWQELKGRIELDKVLGFDISLHGMKERQLRVACEDFFIDFDKGVVSLKFGGNGHHFDWGNDQLFNHLMLKMILNAHSTALMGLLGRYEGNVMTWVRPSNNKLIDRAARYVLQILRQRGKQPSYEEVVEKIFEEIELVKENGPVVLNVVEKF